MDFLWKVKASPGGETLASGRAPTLAIREAMALQYARQYLEETDVGVFHSNGRTKSGRWSWRLVSVLCDRNRQKSPECVNAHDRCGEMGWSCPLCEVPS